MCVFIDGLASEFAGDAETELLARVQGQSPWVYSRGASPLTPVANSSCASAVR